MQIVVKQQKLHKSGITSLATAHHPALKHWMGSFFLPSFSLLFLSDRILHNWTVLNGSISQDCTFQFHIDGWFILLGGIDGRSVIVLIIDLWLYLQNASFALLTLASCVKMQISFRYFVPGHRSLWGMRRCLWTLQENPVGFLEPWLPLFTILARN
jgi:hypothetical protein